MRQAPNSQTQGGSPKESSKVAAQEVIEQIEVRMVEEMESRHTHAEVKGLKRCELFEHYLVCNGNENGAMSKIVEDSLAGRRRGARTR